MTPIRIVTIRHGAQRYDTVGDYQTTPAGSEIRVSDCGNWRHEALIAIHELVEKVLCDHLGITEQAIDDFDFAWQGPGEPGDAATAPYHAPHVTAEIVERIVCQAMGLNWQVYEQALAELDV